MPCSSQTPPAAKQKSALGRLHERFVASCRQHVLEERQADVRARNRLLQRAAQKQIPLIRARHRKRKESEREPDAGTHEGANHLEALQPVSDIGNEAVRMEVAQEVVLRRRQVEQHHRLVDEVPQRQHGLGGERVVFGDDHVRRRLEQRLELHPAVEVDVVRHGDIGTAGLQIANDTNEIAFVQRHREVRMPRCEAPGDPAEQERRGDEVAAHVKLADELLSDSQGAVVEAPLRLQQPARLGDEGSSRWRHRQSPGGIAHEQPVSVMPLEPLDRRADRRRRHVERRARPGDASEVGGGDHVGKVLQVDRHRPAINFSDDIQNFI